MFLVPPDEESTFLPCVHSQFIGSWPREQEQKGKEGTSIEGYLLGLVTVVGNGAQSH